MRASAVLDGLRDQRVLQSATGMSDSESRVESAGFFTPVCRTHAAL